MYIGIQNCGFHKNDHLSLSRRACLTRLPKRNISIRLDNSEILPTFDGKDKEMVQLLVDNCERWYSLQISDYHLDIHNVLRKVYGRILNLTKLVLCRREPAGVAPMSVFEIAPKLRTAETHGSFGLVLAPGNPSLISYKDYPLGVLQSRFAVWPDGYRDVEEYIFRINGIFLQIVASRAKILEVNAIASVPGDIWSAKQVSIVESLLKEGMDISLNGVKPWDFQGA
ncbi:hypothetical protein EDD18DRAFT_1115703 [Armillaria luteobubalina]|uniref:Uncharacterized protein n=1 Tax=Armillaria luteobubalina TaxID=153913 RepID=A0AA39U7A5_9AGAR|nr:hypothetical protein EDD18DRAFT_1115703 [Armillaria luteobubalina]